MGRRQPNGAGLRWGALVAAWWSAAAGTYGADGAIVRTAIFSLLAAGAWTVTAMHGARLLRRRRVRLVPGLEARPSSGRPSSGERTGSPVGMGGPPQYGAA